MPDIPVENKEGQELTTKQPSMFPEKEGKLVVTAENASMLTVHFLSQIYGRLGYIIKLLEKK